MDEKKIRNELAKTLADDPDNYSKILELSTKLAGFDEENVRFSIDAGVIDRSGTELVARQQTTTIGSGGTKTIEGRLVHYWFIKVG